MEKSGIAAPVPGPGLGGTETLVSTFVKSLTTKGNKPKKIMSPMSIDSEDIPIVMGATIEEKVVEPILNFEQTLR
jgi:hypothetical protein